MKQKDLFDRIRKVLRQGWVDIPENRGYGGRGAPGRYLEYLFGTTAGSEDIPDAGKWEIKTTRGDALRDHGTKFRIHPDNVCRVYLNKKRFV